MASDVPPAGGARPGPGTLYLVPTPIGNPRDITLRAVDVLQAVGIVASEDTRHTRTLLGSVGIEARLLSYHDHNEQARTPQLLAELASGVDVALVSDAGTPLVNDPGYRLVTAAIDAGIPVQPLPGASAVLTALIGAGLPVSEFHYAGFLPRRQAARRTALQRLRSLAATLVFFEAPHRLVDTLGDMRDVLGDRAAALARNLTKPDERFDRGPLSELVADLTDPSAGDAVRGQYTIVVAGAPDAPTDETTALADRLAEALLRHGMTPRQTREIVQEVTDLPRNQAYDLVHQTEARLTSAS